MNARGTMVGAVLATLLAGTAFAQTAPLPISQRDSVYQITFSGGLDTAVTQYNVTNTLPAGAADPPAGLLTYKSGFQNFIVGSTGTVTQTYGLTPAAGSTSESGAVTNGGGGGTFFFGYSTPNGPDFTSSWTISTVANGFNVLAFGGVGSQGFGGCGTGFLSIGGIFTCEVFIQGNHPQGTAVGDAYITNLSPGFNVVQNFVYNSGLNATVLAVSDGNWDGTAPGLGFNIVGGAVPEPATWAMMMGGFVALGAAIRARRSRRFATLA